MTAGARKFVDEVTRRLIAGLIVVGLGIGVWLLWPRSEPEPDSTTTTIAAGTTTTAETTTVPESTSSTPSTTTLAVENREEAVLLHGELVEALRMRDSEGARACSIRMLDLAARDLAVAQKAIAGAMANNA